MSTQTWTFVFIGSTIALWRDRVMESSADNSASAFPFAASDRAESGRLARTNSSVPKKTRNAAAKKLGSRPGAILCFRLNSMSLLTALSSLLRPL